MWRYFPDLLAVPVPRYTSYPTAVEFHDGIGADDMAGALATVAPGTATSLYIHIPYCHEICWYCGCNTGAANRQARLAAYLDALHLEIDLVARHLDGRGAVNRMAFGGGSPNAIAPAAFVALVEHLKSAFGATAPVLSIELDPRGFDADWADALHVTGVSRASLGVQTLAADCQAAIGRVQPLEMIVRTTDLLRQAGVSSLNFDLMYGLPFQTTDVLLETLKQACMLSPDRLAVFGYAHVPHMLPRQQRIDGRQLPDAAARFDQAARAHDWLRAQGYAAVGFDHFARPHDALAMAARAGRLHRNFQGFTEDAASVLLGLGASAISAFPHLFVQNEKNSGRYRMSLSAGQLPAQKGVALSREDRLRGAVISDILCHGRADAAAVADFARLRPRLQAFEAASLLEVSGTRLQLTGDGWPYARTIAAVFDAYRQPAAQRFSAAI